VALLAGFACVSLPAAAQVGPDEEPKKPPPPPARAKAPEAPAKVEVRPEARDSEIRARLLAILKATGWFTDPDVTVNEGVVFLNGQTADDESKRWAGELARNTQDVVAVVNRIEVITADVWDFSAAREELRALGRGFLQSLPLLVVALVVLALAWGAARLTSRALRALLTDRLRT
jgi:hypothetical protein